MLNQSKAFNHNHNLTSNLKLFQRLLRTKSSYGSNNGEASADADDEKETKLRLYKSKGQHLLTNPRILDSIVQTSQIKPDDTVLEIGPGTGNLTLKLLQVAKKVVAVEIDKRMVDILHKRVTEHGLQHRLNIISGDALKTEFPQFDLVVANIPYNISSPLLAKLVFGAKANPFRSATLLLQKEFARRLLAKPGETEYNRLAVNVKLMADVEFVMDVSKRDFVPCPKVDSSVVKIYPKNEISDVNLEEWWAFTRTCFSKKNKTLGATFKQKKKLIELMKLSKDEKLSVDSTMVYDNIGDEECSSGIKKSSELFKEKVVNVLETSAFLEKRPSKLSNDDLLKLLSLFNEAGIYFNDHERSSNSFDAALLASDDLF